MFAPHCLDGGLLIDAEHVITRPQRFTFPAASIQIETQDEAARSTLKMPASAVRLMTRPP